MSTQNKKSPHQTDVIVGNNVRRIRMSRGLSQEKLGEALGVTFQQVQKYEKGTNRMGSSRLDQICQALQCSLSDLFSGAGGGSDAQPAALLSQRATHLALTFDQLDEDAKKAVTRIVDVLAKRSSPALQAVQDAA